MCIGSVAPAFSNTRLQFVTCGCGHVQASVEPSGALVTRTVMCCPAIGMLRSLSCLINGAEHVLFHAGVFLLCASPVGRHETHTRDVCVMCQHVFCWPRLEPHVVGCFHVGRVLGARECIRCCMALCKLLA
jgi:hypothetical protein